ncbi:MAG: FKBP-type peptidyl-prolyl cis-trans isomerase [Planctomycetes bacterium]|nr:FKBP-type peptidyl-prolyl cis-trans isomerase [Planctomycetota bacterium]
MPRFSLACAGLLLAVLGGCGSEEMSINEEAKTLKDLPGRGEAARDGDIVCIDFRVVVPDEDDDDLIPKGTEVLYGENFCFTLGAGAVIAGVDESVPGMQIGGRRIIMCPPHMHWGRGGYGNGAIPSNTSLLLDLKLHSIE